MIYPEAIWLPGPQENVYWGDNAMSGVICHSAEGHWSDTYSPVDTMLGQGVSWPLTVMQDGSVWQHYSLKTRCWQAGSPWGNFNLIGIEHEGTASEKLTPLQVTASVRLVRWIASQRGWRLERGKTLFEHREVSTTACPNGRIPWEKYTEEEDVEVKPLAIQAAIEKVQRFVRNSTDAIDPSDGDGMYEIVAGFPNAKPDYEYVVLEMRKDA